MAELTLIKYDGTREPYDVKKISAGILRAAQEVDGGNRFIAAEIAGAIDDYIHRNLEPGQTEVNQEAVEDMTEKVLIETGHAKTCKVYILNRERKPTIRAERTGKPSELETRKSSQS